MRTVAGLVLIHYSVPLYMLMTGGLSDKNTLTSNYSRKGGGGVRFMYHTQRRVSEIKCKNINKK